MTKKMFWLVLGVSLLLVGPSTVALAEGPSPNEIHIRDLTYGGSGCPGGSAATSIAPDGQAFTLIFDSFLAQIGSGIPLAESRKNCQVNLTLFYPQGFTFAIYAVDYRGFANIARGAKGLQKAIYYFQGQSPQASTWRGFNGPYNNDWHIRDEIAEAALVWSPCGVLRSVNINAQLRLDKGTSRAESFMQMDSEDGSIRQIYHLRWRRCNR